MNKKFLSLVLALVMVLGTFSSVFAAPAEKKETKEAPKAAETVVPKITGKKAKIQWLQDNKYVEGRKVNKDAKNNDLALDKTIQRDEVSKLLVYAIGLDQKADALKGAYKFYNDVDLSHWANGYINVGSTEPSKANNLPFLLGYPGKVFKPVNNVTYAELAKMLVTLTKTDLTKDMHDQANKEWPVKWMAWAHDLGIFEDVTVADANKAVNREDAFTMIYNAMYKLKYIQKMPVGEVRGILSQIKNGEITINQGEKAKTIKLMPNTTFVLYDRRSNTDTHDVNANPHHSVYNQIVFAGAVSNPSYYYGSFVRVIANEKGEATHVLELGNPAQLAIGNSNDDRDNDRWNDVAERTIETVDGQHARTIDDDAWSVKDAVLAKVNYDNGDPKSITFQKGFFRGPSINATGDQSVRNWTYMAKANDWSRTLKLTANTKYYVADVVQNQLTEVKDVDEALRILGNTAASNWFDSVYAGYNVIDGADKHVTRAATHINGYNEATVVVFNKVQKDNNNEQLLRVKNEATRLYDVTFEDVDGKEIMGNLISYRGAFPFNFNDGKYNVVRITENNATGTGIELVIKHSDEEKYPIVKVTDVFNNGRSIIVEDKNEHSAFLQLTSEADIFTRGLKVGDVIQFHTLAGNVLVNDADRNNVVDVVSILPSNVALDGALQFVVEDNQNNQRYAEGVTAFDIKAAQGDYRQVDVNEYMYLYNKKVGTNKTFAWLNVSDANKLEEYINAVGPTNISYKLRRVDRLDKLVAYDVEVMVKKDGKDVWVKLNDAAVSDAIAKKAQKDALDAFDKKVAAVEDATKLADQAAFDKAAKALQDLVTEFNALKVDKLEQSDVDKVKANLNTKIKALNDVAAAKSPAITTNPAVSEI